MCGCVPTSTGGDAPITFGNHPSGRNVCVCVSQTSRPPCPWPQPRAGGKGPDGTQRTNKSGRRRWPAKQAHHFPSCSRDERWWGNFQICSSDTSIRGRSASGSKAIATTPYGHGERRVVSLRCRTRMNCTSIKSFEGSRVTITQWSWDYGEISEVDKSIDR